MSKKCCNLDTYLVFLLVLWKENCSTCWNKTFRTSLGKNKCGRTLLSVWLQSSQSNSFVHLNAQKQFEIFKIAYAYILLISLLFSIDCQPMCKCTKLRSAQNYYSKMWHFAALLGGEEETSKSFWSPPISTFRSSWFLFTFMMREHTLLGQSLTYGV